MAAIETLIPGIAIGSLAPCRAGGSDRNHRCHSSFIPAKSASSARITVALTILAKALPASTIFDIPPEHPIRHMVFPVDEVEQVTNINNWMRTGNTSERGTDSPFADFRGIADARGRLMVVMTHNTDFGDSWERESENREFFERFSPKGYAMGINVLLYALTH